MADVTLEEAIREFYRLMRLYMSGWRPNG